MVTLQAVMESMSAVVANELSSKNADMKVNDNDIYKAHEGWEREENAILQKRMISMIASPMLVLMLNGIVLLMVMLLRKVILMFVLVLLVFVVFMVELMRMSVNRKCKLRT